MNIYNTISYYPSAGETGRFSLALNFLMIEFLMFYLSFALAGGIMSYFKIMRPVIKRLKAEGNLAHPYVTSSITSCITWVVLATVVIPFMAYALIDDEQRNAFIDYVYEGAK